MLHLVDRFVALVFGELVDPPVLQHAVVQPVLVDRGELVGERLVEIVNDLRIALHDAFSCRVRVCAQGERAGKGLVPKNRRNPRVCE